MIDIESKVYTPIAEQLREKYPGIDVAGEYINSTTLPGPFWHTGTTTALSWWN